MGRPRMAPEEEKGSQVRLPGGGGSLTVKEGNEWQVMSICQGADTKGVWPSFLKPNALAFLFQPQTEVLRQDSEGVCTLHSTGSAVTMATLGARGPQEVVTWRTSQQPQQKVPHKPKRRN